MSRGFGGSAGVAGGRSLGDRDGSRGDLRAKPPVPTRARERASATPGVDAAEARSGSQSACTKASNGLMAVMEARARPRSRAAIADRALREKTGRRRTR